MKILSGALEEFGDHFWIAITSDGVIVRIVSATPQPRLVADTNVAVVNFTMSYRTGGAVEGVASLFLKPESIVSMLDLCV
jgi:hypothetical protein